MTQPDPPRTYWQAAEDASRPPLVGGRRTLVSVVTVAVCLAVVTWTVLGGLLEMAMLTALSLEGGGGDTGHSQEFTLISAVWVVGMIVGWVAFRAGVRALRRGRPKREMRVPSGWGQS